MGRSFVDFCRNNLYEVIAERVREHTEGCGGELQNMDLSMEYVVLQPKYRELFTLDERKICYRRLKDFGFDCSNISIG